MLASRWDRIQIPTFLRCGLLGGSIGGAPVTRNHWSTVRLVDMGSASTWRLMSCSPSLLPAGPPFPVVTWTLQAPSWEEFLSRWPSLAYFCPISALSDLKHPGLSSLEMWAISTAATSPSLNSRTEQALRVVHLSPPISAVYSEIPEEKISLHYTANFSVHLKLL